jgi:peptidoglycan hydrolase-like protein with peptidoglycan-binding domain
VREAPARRKRPPGQRARQRVEEDDSLLNWLADRIIQNPGRSGGILLIAVVMAAIVSNAAFMQTKRHPDPLFATRHSPVEATPSLLVPAPEAESSTVPLPVPRNRSEIRLPHTPQPIPAAVATKPVAAKPVAAKPAAADNLVANTQKALAAAKLYKGTVDGVMGPQTRSAISAFEKKIGLIPTGKPSERLLAEIRKGLPRAPAAEPVSTGSIDDGQGRSRMKRVQAALNEIGYGPVDVDGRGGGKTTDAIRRFELDNGLPMTGAAGDAVIAKLVLIGALGEI